MIRKIVYITFIFLPLFVFGVHAEQASGVQGAATVASNLTVINWCCLILQHVNDFSVVN